LKPHLAALGLSGEMSAFSFTDPVLEGYAYPVVGNALLLDIYPQRWRAILVHKR
jgi:hypothetical protein